MREDIIYLVGSGTITYDNVGNPVKTASTKEAFCIIESITQAEFFKASQSGLKPQIKVTMCEYDYSNETTVQYNNKKYTVYRTYLRNDERIELYLTEKAGA